MFGKNRKRAAAIAAAEAARRQRISAAAFRAANHADNVLTGTEAATPANGDVWGWSR